MVKIQQLHTLTTNESVWNYAGQVNSPAVELTMWNTKIIDFLAELQLQNLQVVCSVHQFASF